MLTIIQNQDLKDIKDSINYLLNKALESEEVRQFAVSVVGHEPDPIAAIYDWVKLNVRYTPDPVRKPGDEIELFISPVRMIRDYGRGLPLAGDCDDMALLLTALYRAVGINANLVILDTQGTGYDHAICQAYSEKLQSWVNVDASSQYPLGWEIKYYKKEVV